MKLSGFFRILSPSLATDSELSSENLDPATSPPFGQICFKRHYLTWSSRVWTFRSLGKVNETFTHELWWRSAPENLLRQRPKPTHRLNPSGIELIWAGWSDQVLPSQTNLTKSSQPCRSMHSHWPANCHTKTCATVMICQCYSVKPLEIV